MLTVDDLAGGAVSLDPPDGVLGSGWLGAGGVGGLFPPEGDVTAGTAGSALRMIGRPSFPEPMMTIFVLGDCASKRVASMPRQRR